MAAASVSPPVLCLMGATATGKTDLAMELASSHPFELVSVDSAMVYRGLDIGTAKPPPDVLALHPHHLVDIRDPADSYSAADFQADAERLIADIHARGRIPLLVGGTMLYFKALKVGLSPLPGASPEIRAGINALAAAEGWGAVHAELARVDPASARRIHPNDPQRLQRALEVFRVSGQTLTELHEAEGSERPFRLVEVGLVPEDRAALHARIADRFEAMLAAGFIDEVRSLVESRGDLDPDLPAMRAVGYRQVLAMLEGACGREEMIERALAATRQLAKRQLTWMRSWEGLHRIPADIAVTPAEVLKIAGAAIILA